MQSADEIGRLAQRFNYMAEQLNYHTKNLRNFVANVAHEVRTPLASLSLIIKSLKNYQMEPEQRQEFLDDLDREMDRLIALVQDLLDLTTLEGGAARFAPVDLREVTGKPISRRRPVLTIRVRLLTDLTRQKGALSGAAPVAAGISKPSDNALKSTASEAG